MVMPRSQKNLIYNVKNQYLKIQKYFQCTYGQKQFNIIKEDGDT